MEFNKRILLVLLFSVLCVYHARSESLEESHPVKTNKTERYKVVSFNFRHVEVPYVICLWILLASIAKIGE